MSAVIQFDQHYKELVEKAKTFAERVFEGRIIRRYDMHVPSINHTSAVVDIVQSIPHTNNMVIIAWLHDVMKDAHVTPTELTIEFSESIARAIVGITPSKDNDLCIASIDAQTVKMAEIIDDITNMPEQDSLIAQTFLQERKNQYMQLKWADSILREIAQKHFTGSTTWKEKSLQ